jgi:hypothetical protein
MSVVIARLDEAELPPNVLRLRAHAALVRTLLDELERAAPSPAGRPGAARLASLAEHLAEELGGLARRMLECAAVATRLAADATRGQSEPDRTRSSGADADRLPSTAEASHRAIGPALMTER